MKITLSRGFVLAGALSALALVGRAQVVELHASLDQSQETPPTGSGATGSAIMLYDARANTFDLLISISGMANVALASHIHEAAAGVAGPAVTSLGSDASYTRSGNTLTATFRSIPYGGTPLTLLQGGAYYNIHSAQFPGGEIRGQLIARPKKLVAIMNVAQETAAMPNVDLSSVNPGGGAVMLYDPVANRISLRLSLYRFGDILNNSGFEVGAPGVSGPVVTNLGNNANGTFANGGSYTNADGYIAGSFDIPYTGDPIKLLTGGTYLNFRSTLFPGGETRGQVSASDEVPGSRFANISTRGFVGPGEQVLIQGITNNGPEPLRVLITAKGPSLSKYGIANPLPNPQLALYGGAGRRIALNVGVGPVAAGSELAAIPGYPTNPAECALVLVLPPANFTVIVSSANSGSGVALLEVTDLRNLAGLGQVTAKEAESPAPVRD